MLRDTLVMLWKDLLWWRRTRVQIAAGVIPVLNVGLVLLLFVSFAGRGGFGAALAVGDGAAAGAPTPAAAQLADQFRAARFPDGSPYFRLSPADAGMARKMVENQELWTAYIIEPGFDAAVRAGQTATVTAVVNNLNADAAKNARLRPLHIFWLFRQARGEAFVQIEEQTTLPRDVSWVSYVSATVIALALIFSPMVNAALLVGREWGGGTVRPLLVTPVRRGAVVAAKLAGGTVLGLLVSLLVLVITGLLGRTWPAAHPLLFAGFALLAAGAAAGMGAMLGIWLRQPLKVVTWTAILSILSWILGGALMPPAMGAGLGRAVATCLPTTYVTDGVLQLTVGTLDGARLTLDVAVVAGTLLAATVLGSLVLRRRLEV